MNEQAIAEGVKLFAMNGIGFLNVEKKSDLDYGVTSTTVAPLRL
jgi:hypothetical protein